MAKSRKLSRKKDYFIADKSGEITRPGSILELVNPITKNSEFYAFASNPNKPLKDTKEQLLGKTTLLGKGTSCRVKFAIPVQPSPDKNRFIETKNETKIPKVIKIVEIDKSDDLPSEVTLHNHLFFHNQHPKKGKLYFATDYKGETFTTVAKKAGADSKSIQKSHTAPQAIDFLNLKQFLQLTCDMAKVIQGYHKKNVANGDLSDDNISLIKQGNSIIPSITDFDCIVMNNSRNEKMFKLLCEKDFEFVIDLWNSCMQIYKQCTSSNVYSDEFIQSIIKATNPEKISKSNKKIDLQDKMDLFINTCIEKIELLKTETLTEENGLLHSSISALPVLTIDTPKLK